RVFRPGRPGGRTPPGLGFAAAGSSVGSVRFLIGAPLEGPRRHGRAASPLRRSAPPGVRPTQRLRHRLPSVGAHPGISRFAVPGGVLFSARETDRPLRPPRSAPAPPRPKRPPYGGVGPSG